MTSLPSILPPRIQLHYKKKKTEENNEKKPTKIETEISIVDVFKNY